MWRFELFGNLRGFLYGEPSGRFSSPFVAGLVAYLAAHKDRAVARDELLFLLWPDEDPSIARNRLNQLLFAVRPILEPDLPKGSVLQTDRLTVRLANVQTDIEEFESHRQANDLEAALALYKGEFLADSHLEWAYAKRQEWNDEIVALCRELIAIYKGKEQYEAAIRAAQRALKIDALQEDLHREVIELYIASGNSAGAARQYRELERILQRDLGVFPSAASQALSQKIAHKSAITPAPIEPAIPTLPTYLTTFFGREGETATTLDALERGRLITLIGPGGIGKTRLAVRVASRYGHPAWFVPLADIDRAEQIWPKVRETLGLDPSGDIASRLQTQERPLLILDNFEQIEARGANEALRLLESVADLRLLVTSRHSLGLQGEVEIQVRPLLTPAQKTGRLKPEEIRELPSVQLFLDHARAVRADFQITPARLETIAHLTDRLEGIPLAIELAATWMQTLTPGQILGRLSHRFHLLTSRKQDATERHRTLRTAIDYSFDLLGDDLRHLFAALSIFRGGWSLELAEAIADEPREVLSQLAELRGRSLIVVEMPGEEAEARGLGARYRMLETLREYAGERLEAEDRDTYQRRHLAHWSHRSAEVERGLKGADQGLWIHRLAADSETLADVLDWAATYAPAEGLLVASRLWRFWYFRRLVQQGIERLERLLAASKDQIPEAKTDALIGLAFLTMASNRIQDAIGVFEQALAQAQANNDPIRAAACLNGLGYASRELNDWDGAIVYYSDAMAITSGREDRYVHAAIAGNLAELYAVKADWYRALAAHQEALRLWSEIGAEFYVGLTYIFLTHEYRHLGDMPAAIAAAKRGTEICHRLGAPEIWPWSVDEAAALSAMAKREEQASILMGIAAFEESGQPIPTANPLQVNTRRWMPVQPKNVEMNTDNAYEFVREELDILAAIFNH